MSLLSISQDTLIQLPDGASGAAVRVTYNGVTTGTVIASGDDQGRAVITTGRLAKLMALDEKTALQVVGRESGGRRPALVTLRIYPEYPVGKSGPIAPITLTGLPVGAPDTPGIWDLSNIDDASGGLDVVTPAERQTIALLREQAAQTVAQAQADQKRVGEEIARSKQQTVGTRGLLDQVALSRPTVTSSSESGPYTTPYANGNPGGENFSGWHWNVGVAGKANRVVLKVFPFNAAYPVTLMRVAVKTADGSVNYGEVGPIAVNCPVGQVTEIAFDLPATIDTTKELFLFAFSNGRWVPGLTSKSSKGIALSRDSNVNAAADLSKLSSGGIAEMIYARWELGDYTQPVLTAAAPAFTALLPSSGTDLNAVYGTPDLLLTRKMRMLKRAGDQFSLYFRELSTGTWYRNSLVDVVCNYGRQYEECWRLEPTSGEPGYSNPALGTFDLTVKLTTPDFVTVKSATTQMVLLDASTTTAVRFGVMGDSTVEQELFQKQVLTLPNTVSQGLRSIGGTVNHDGRSGWTLANFFERYATNHAQESLFMFPADLGGVVYRGNTLFWRNVRAANSGGQAIHANGQNQDNSLWRGINGREGGADWAYGVDGYPLNPQVGWVVYDPLRADGQRFRKWDGAAWAVNDRQGYAYAFDMVKYAARFAWAYANGGPTHYAIKLGINDTQNLESGISDILPTFVNRLQTAIDSMRAAWPSCKVLILLNHCGTTQDAWGAFRGSSMTAERERRNMQQLNRRLIDVWDTAEWEGKNVYVIAAGLGVDPTYGYENSWEFANKYANLMENKTQVLKTTDDTKTVIVPIQTEHVRRSVNWVHPTGGLYQFGDWVAAAVQATR